MRLKKIVSLTSTSSELDQFPVQKSSIFFRRVDFPLFPLLRIVTLISRGCFLSVPGAPCVDDSARATLAREDELKFQHILENLDIFPPFFSLFLNTPKDRNDTRESDLGLLLHHH